MNWMALAPEQVAVAPVACDMAGLRAVLYEGRETLARCIVAGHETQVSVVAVLGRREAEARSVTLRERDGAQSSIPLNQVGEVSAARR